jgi:hypothetical protein
VAWLASRFCKPQKWSNKRANGAARGRQRHRTRAIGNRAGTRAIPDRDVFYVAHPIRSIETRSLGLTVAISFCVPQEQK